MRKNVFFRKCIAISVVLIMLIVPSLSYASMFFTPNIGNYGSLIGSSNGLDYGSMIGSSAGLNYGNLTGLNNLFDYGGIDSSYNKPDYSEYYGNQDFGDIFDEIESMKEDKTSNTTDDSLEEINDLLQNIDTDLPISDTRVEIIEKATEIRDDNEESDITAIISNILINESIAASPTDTTNDLLGSIKESLGNLIGGGISFESLEPDVIVNDMVATTAGKLAGNDFKVKLSGNIYFAETDRNGKPTSDKWVVLVHGFMMNGQAIADSLGEMYLNRGINVLAPDLRGFGDSEGSVAMGYLESLDVWDWLTYLNKNYDCEEIFVHGVSLGGATTVFVSGLEVDGKTMEDQNVIGLIEDCGYASMTGIITDMIGMGSDENFLTTLLGDVIKTLIMDIVGVGLTDDNFDTRQNALNSLANSTLPLLIVHGTSDTTVPVSNSDKIYAAAMQNSKIPYVQRYLADGGVHAFITVGMNRGEYEAHLGNFIDVAEAIADGRKVDKEGTFDVNTAEQTSILGVLVSAVKLIKNIF